MTLLELKPLIPQMLNAVMELDQLCFGGFWTLESYRRELDSPNSDLLGVFAPPLPLDPNLHKAGISYRSQSWFSPPLLAMGCLWAILEEAHITILAVHPHYQREGLGQAMLIALLTAAERRGLERATLEVRASNQPALCLYQKFGFKQAGRRRRYYQDTGEDALVLWRGDLQHPEFAKTLANWDRQVRVCIEAAGWELQVNLNPPISEDSSLTLE